MFHEEGGWSAKGRVGETATGRRRAMARIGGAKNSARYGRVSF
jgi:hypothetical protein